MGESRNLLLLIITAATGLLLLAIAVGVLFPSIYEQKLEDETTLKENSLVYGMWTDLPLPIYQRMYFFNVTNAQQYMKYGGILEVEEVGPYTYRSQWVKKDIERHDNGTISYREVKTFQFVSELSVGGQDDFVYTLNGPLLLAADFLRDKGPMTRKAADKAFRLINEKLVIKARVRELAFDGYSDPIIAFSKFFRPETPFRNSKFSWLYGRNATDDGEFTVFTGEPPHHDRLNVIDRYNGAPALDFWPADPCNRINGSNAEFGPPLRDDQTEYTFFQPIFCRSLTFHLSGTYVHEGVLSRRFRNTDATLSKSNPENACFYADPLLDSGVMDVRACQFQAPIVLSFPHFFLADPAFLANVEGLEPSEARHGSHVDVEPLTGATVDLSIKFQLNIRMWDVEHLSMLRNVEPGVYPVFWVDISANLTDDLASTLRNNLYLPKDVAFAVVFCLVIVSAIMIVASVYRLLKLRGHSYDVSEKKPLLMKDQGVAIANKSGAINEALTNATVISDTKETVMSK